MIPYSLGKAVLSRGNQSPARYWRVIGGNPWLPLLSFNLLLLLLLQKHSPHRQRRRLPLSILLTDSRRASDFSHRQFIFPVVGTSRMIKEEKEITYQDQHSVHLFLRDASYRRPLLSISRLSIHSFDPSPSVAIILISRGFYKIALEVGYVVAGDPQIPCVAINPTPFPTTSHNYQTKSDHFKDPPKVGRVLERGIKRGNALLKIRIWGYR